MLNELMSRQPEAFSGLTSAFSQWVLAQHYGLKTRLLDITRNPLVALFNACEEDGEKDGRLHVFAVPSDLIKSFNSDTVSIIANFAKLRHAEQNLLLLLGKNAGRPPMKTKTWTLQTNTPKSWAAFIILSGKRNRILRNKSTP